MGYGSCKGEFPDLTRALGLTRDPQFNNALHLLMSKVLEEKAVKTKNFQLLFNI
jgi:hypothetical protein